MTKKNFFKEFLWFLAILFILSTFSSVQATPIEVYFDPLDSTVFLDDTFSIRLAANIPDPVDKFGLDLDFVESILSLDTISIGPLWGMGFSLDGDGLAGLAPFDPMDPMSVGISGVDITLAILNFTANNLGDTDLITSYTVMMDPTEGFLKPPPAFPMSRYDDVVFIDGSVSVVPIPEPASFILLVMGVLTGIGLGYLRRI